MINRLCLFESANPDITIYINVAPIEGGVNALGRYDIKVSYDIELERSADRHLLLREWLLPVCALDFWLAMVAGETNAKSVLPVTTDLATHRLLLNAPDASDWRCWLAARGCDRAQVKQLLGGR